MKYLYFYCLSSICLSLLTPAVMAAPKCTDTFKEPTVRFARGSATSTNLRLLKNYEKIPTEIRDRLTESLAKKSNYKRKRSQAIALDFLRNPSEASRQRLYHAVEILVPLAIRPIAHLIKDVDQLQDLIQTGKLALWKQLGYFERTPIEKVESIMYWDGVLNGLRATIFAAMRLEYRTLYSLTPVKFPKTSEFTFEEEVLLFGDTQKSLDEIARRYGVSAQEIAREQKIQAATMWDQLSDKDTPEAQVESVNDQFDVFGGDLKRVTDKFMSNLTAREERVIRLIYHYGMTQEQISQQMGFTKPRVGQLHEKALNKMRRPGVARRSFDQDLTLPDYIDTIRTFRAEPREYWDPAYRKLKKELAEQKAIQKRQAMVEAAARDTLEASVRAEERAIRVDVIKQMLIEYDALELVETLWGAPLDKDFNKKGAKATISGMGGLNMASQDIFHSESYQDWAPIIEIVSTFLKTGLDTPAKVPLDATAESIANGLFQKRMERMEKLSEDLQEFFAEHGPRIAIFQEVLALEQEMQKSLMTEYLMLTEEGYMDPWGKTHIEPHYNDADLAKRVFDFYKERSQYHAKIIDTLTPAIGLPFPGGPAAFFETRPDGQNELARKQVKRRKEYIRQYQNGRKNWQRFQSTLPL